VILYISTHLRLFSLHILTDIEKKDYNLYISMELLPIKFDFNKNEILQKTIRANSALAELNLLINSITNFDLLLQPLTAREAVASSEIENIRTTTLELLQAELMQPNELTSAQKETLSYKKALKLGYNIVKEKNKIHIKDIVSVQELVAPLKSGLRKKEVVIANRFGEIVYQPPKFDQVQDLLENFDFYFNFDNELDPLINMAITHFQFESIHPFLDGNGRTGRILNELYLVLKNKLKYPVLFLSGYILESKPYYYQLFSEVREQNNWTAWVLYFLNGIEQQAKETTLRITKIKELELNYSRIIEVKLNVTKKEAIQNYFFSKAFYTQTNIIKELGISRPTASRYFKILLDEGDLEMRKVGREILYFIPEFVELLS
jgi:Fic family protein